MDKILKKVIESETFRVEVANSVANLTPGGRIKLVEGTSLKGSDFCVEIAKKYSKKHRDFAVLFNPENTLEVLKRAKEILLEREKKNSQKAPVEGDTAADFIRTLEPFYILNSGEVIYLTKDDRVLSDLELEAYLMTTGEKKVELFSRIKKGVTDFDPFLKSRVVENQGKFLNYGEQVWILNTYNPPEWMRSKVEPYIDPRIMELINHLFNGDEYTIDYIFCWLKQMIIGRNATILCLSGTKGIGKNKFTDICILLVGEDYSATHTTATLDDKFNYMMYNRRFGLYDEMVLNPHRLNNLKLFANDKIPIEKKGSDPIMVTNYNSFAFLTNNRDGLLLSPSDRRFSIPVVTDITATHKELGMKPETLDYLSYMRKNPNDPEVIDVIAGFGKFLLQYESKFNFDPNVPLRSPLFYECCLSHLQAWQKFVIGTIETRRADEYSIPALKKEFTKLQQQFGSKSHFPDNDEKIKNFLVEWSVPSIATIRKTVDPNTKREHSYLVPHEEYMPVAEKKEEVEDGNLF